MFSNTALFLISVVSVFFCVSILFKLRNLNKLIKDSTSYNEKLKKEIEELKEEKEKTVRHILKLSSPPSSLQRRDTHSSAVIPKSVKRKQTISPNTRPTTARDDILTLENVAIASVLFLDDENDSRHLYNETRSNSSYDDYSGRSYSSSSNNDNYSSSSSSSDSGSSSSSSSSSSDSSSSSSSSSSGD